jgi:hypothetical protein
MHDHTNKYHSREPRRGPLAQVQHGMCRILLQCKYFICRYSIRELPKRGEDDVKVEEVLLPIFGPQHEQEAFH